MNESYARVVRLHDRDSPSVRLPVCLYFCPCVSMSACVRLSVLMVASATECSMFPMAIVLSRNISIVRPLSNQRFDPSPVRPKRACSFSSYIKNRSSSTSVAQIVRQTDRQTETAKQGDKLTDAQRERERQTNRQTN